MITTLTKTFTIAVQGKKEINEVVTLLRILQEFVFTPPSIQWDEIISLQIILKWQDNVCFAENIQGQPLGFDTKYLALADRNMQVRFSLKVVWES